MRKNNTHPLREVELRVEVGAAVPLRIVVAQFGLQGQSGQAEEALLSGRLAVPQHVLAQLVIIVLARHSIPSYENVTLKIT